MRDLVRRFFIRPRDGFSLLDVALATVVITTGTLFMGTYFRTVYDHLDPRGQSGGIRKYLMAEQMIKAQCEGLRLLQNIAADAGGNRVVTPPQHAGSNYNWDLKLTQYIGGSDTNAKLYYFDVAMWYDAKLVATISMSTLRRLTDDGTLDSGETAQNEKIGL